MKIVKLHFNEFSSITVSCCDQRSDILDDDDDSVEEN